MITKLLLRQIVGAKCQLLCFAEINQFPFLQMLMTCQKLLRIQWKVKVVKNCEITNFDYSTDLGMFCLCIRDKDQIDLRYNMKSHNAFEFVGI